jgi:tripartite-type tricarboxylate transporter receptor subunit TctC
VEDGEVSRCLAKPLSRPYHQCSKVHRADGYQFVVGNVGTHAANQSFYKSPLYNAATDFAPVVLIAETPLVLLARKDFPANNLLEFIT